MRKIILDSLLAIKNQEDGFKKPEWNDFYFGAVHISTFEFQGIPTDSLLFDFYKEVMDWCYVIEFTGVPPKPDGIRKTGRINRQFSTTNGKTIEVTDEMYEFLMNLSNELNTQDNRSTAMPYFFQIQTQEEVPAADGNGNEAWIGDGSGSKIETEEEITEAIAEHKGLAIEDVTTDRFERENLLEEAGYRKIYYELKDKLQNAFLTAKACEAHINGNLHHYHTPVSYLSHSFRNPELETLLKFICGLTKKGKDEG